MSRIRIVKGVYTKITHGNHNMFSQGNIESYADNIIKEKGEEGGVSHGAPSAYNSIINTFKVVKLEGPFNNQNKLVKYISRNKKYTYIVTLDKDPSTISLAKLTWAVSYDGQRADNSYRLFKGGSVYGKGENKVKVEMQISKGDHKITIYAYTGIIPDDNIKVDTKFRFVTAFFIGGAGDKRPYLGSGPNNNILYAKRPFDKNFQRDYKSFYLGYYEVYPIEDIAKNVEANIESKEIPVYIIGHSLGGWNGAHLAQILSDKGYMVEMLITLDPVGWDLIVNKSSEIYPSPPVPKSKYWINIFTDPKDYGFSDFIADMGGQWVPKSPKPDLSSITKASHLDADMIFTDKVCNRKSASDFLQESIQNFLYVE